MDSAFTWLTLPAEMSSLGPFTEFVHDGARSAALPEAEFGKLDLVMEEILVNVFSYGYPDGNGVAEVGYQAEPGNLRVQIRDQGPEFNPLLKETPDLDLDLEHRPIGGLGIFLVKTLATSVGYERLDGRNILSFSLRVL